MRSEAARTSAVLLAVLAALGAAFSVIALAAGRTDAHAARSASEASGTERPPEREPRARLAPARDVAEEQARSTIAPAEPEIEEPVVAASVTGVVVGPGGHHVHPARVVLESVGRAAVERAVDPEGRFSFALEPGRAYSLSVAAGSLPDGFLEPWGQDRGAAPFELRDLPAGFFGTTVHVPPEGGAFDVVLRAFHAGQVTGRVLGPRGAAVHGAGVRLQSASVPGLVRDARTGADGHYAFEALYPDTYLVDVRLSQTVEPAYRALPQPERRELVVEEGAHCRAPDVTVPMGRRALRGSVVDADGQPLEGLTVTCELAERTDGDDVLLFSGGRLATTVSAADGTFAFEGLPARLVRAYVAEGGSLVLAASDVVDLARTSPTDDRPDPLELPPLVVRGD